MCDMNRRHTDRPSILSDYAFWAMALSYVAIIALVWGVAAGTVAVLGWVF
jgi:hypothetical protein